MKRNLIFISLLALSTSVYAGGSLFGGHKSRTSNPNGVSSIGIHICGNLNCPDVIIKKGDCGTVEHATKKYGVCVCDDGFQVQGDKCVSKAPSCDKLDKVRKTYYIGACCDVPVEGLFCPEEDPPTCEKMDETTCAVTTETDCENAGGDWVCNGTSCRCAPHGSNTCCPGGGDCIACKPDEEQKCSIMAEGTCRKDGIKADCNDVYCIACSNGLIPDCSLGVIPEERCQCVEENCPNVYGELSTGENTGTSPIGTLSDGTPC